MLYHWLYPLSQKIAVFNVFKYITLRSFVAFFIAIIFSIIWGKYFIDFMRSRQFGQSIRDDGPASHLKKAGTPTLGGVLIIGTVLLSIGLTGNFTSHPFLVLIAVTLSYFALGCLDDYLKIVEKSSAGVSARAKLVWQFATALLAAWYLQYSGTIDGNLYIPFIKGPLCDLGWYYVPFSALVIVGSSNAVNITDGLDGLAIGPTITSAASLGLLAYVTGHVELANYLFIPYIPDVGEVLVFASAVIGAGMGFLWYNSHPAQIFMGDVGSLSLGGALGTIAVLTKNEVLFILIGGIFVIEVVSVILQVASFKLRRKRIFKMAPIHHHFELLGYSESKVIVRFWIISAFFAILSLATLKLR